MITPILKSLGFFSLLALVGCIDLNSPYGQSNSGGYYDPYTGTYDSDYYRNQREQERLDREREDLEDERERLERERENQNNSYHPPAPPPPRQDHCPSGFSPSEQKCTPQERSHGCKDIRLPSGLGCVSR